MTTSTANQPPVKSANNESLWKYDTGVPTTSPQPSIETTSNNDAHDVSHEAPPCEPVQPADNEPAECWQCIPDGEINSMTHAELQEYVEIFPKNFDIELPADHDAIFADTEQLRKWVRETARCEKVRQVYEQQETDRREEARRIVITGVPPHEITDLALYALNLDNNPPWLFVRGTNDIVRVIRDCDDRPHIDTLDLDGLRGILDRHADFYRITATQTEIRIRAPKDVVKDIMSLPDLPFPPLRGITQCPTISLSKGSITETPGYDRETRLYYMPVPGFELPLIPENPSAEDLKKAVDILSEIFCDFPFEDDASRANAIGMLFSAVLRPSISGLVPLALIDKPVMGCGGTTLAELISVIATGEVPACFDAPESESEWSKKLLSVLLEGRTLAIIDNIDSKLSSATLAGILTSQRWSGRILTQSRMAESSTQHLIWIGTGINIQIGGDLARRIYWIRLNPQMAQPWTKTTYRHPDLLKWVRAERENILAAILTLTRAWIRAGKPKAVSTVPRLGGFGEWQDTIGGILAYAGITGFLGNLNQMYKEIDRDADQADAFFAKWYDIWGPDTVTVIQIYDHLDDAEIKYSKLDLNNPRLLDVLPDDLSDAWAGKKTFNTKMGQWLSKHKDRVFRNGYRLTKGKAHHHAACWTVSLIEQEGAS